MGHPLAFFFSGATLRTSVPPLTYWKRPWCWERLKAGGERGWQRVSSQSWCCGCGEEQNACLCLEPSPYGPGDCSWGLSLITARSSICVSLQGMSGLWLSCLLGGWASQPKAPDIRTIWEASLMSSLSLKKDLSLSFHCSQTSLFFLFFPDGRERQKFWGVQEA